MAVYQSEFQGATIDARLAAVVTMQTAISNLETAVAAKYSKPASGIPETDLDAAVQSALAKARSAVQDLSNYYTKTEIDSLLAAVNSQEYIDVTVLPTASASTLGKIYLVGPDADSQYARYYTSYDGSSYSWVAAGSTEINLANYATKAELDQLEQKLGITTKGVVDFTVTGGFASQVAIPFSASAGDAINLTVKNTGTSYADVSIYFIKTDESAVLIGTFAGDSGVSETKRYGLSYDISAVRFNLRNYRSTFDISIENPDNLIAQAVENKAEIARGRNFCYPGEIQKSKAINSTGAIVDALAMFGVTGKIPFDENGVLTCNCCPSTGNGYKAVVYDKNDTPLSIQPTAVDSTTLYNVPGGVYARFTIDNRYSYPIQVNNAPSVLPYSAPSEIGGYQRINIIYAYSTPGTNDATHFYGNTAIRDAIAAINDESGSNIYIIKAKGHFLATVPSDYVKQVGGHYVMFDLRPFIYLEGVSKDATVIRAELPDTVAACQANVSEDQTFANAAQYGYYQPINIQYGCHIKNIRFISRNTRYPAHVDGADLTPSRYMDFMFESCDFINEGKFGDAVGTDSFSPSGFGSSSGSKLIFKDCYFEGLPGLYVHDNSTFVDEADVEWINCVVNNKAQGSTFADGTSQITSHSLSFQFKGNPYGSKINIINTRFNDLPYALFSNIAASKYLTDNLNARMRITDKPMPIRQIVNLYGLRVTANSSGVGSIRFDPESSAFNAIIGDSTKVCPVAFNRYGRAEQYGYEWRDGGAGQKAEAIGLNTIDTSSYKLGSLLGDCSVTNKVLRITVNGTDYNVTFSENYTSQTNDYVLAAINAVIGSVATADLYPVLSEYFPDFDNMGVHKVDENGAAISCGMGVVFTSEGVRRAVASDTKIDGIAIDAGAYGQYIRVIYAGGINYNSYYRLALALGTGQTSSLAFGTKLGISSTEAGKFVANATNPTMIVRNHDAAYFLS